MGRLYWIAAALLASIAVHAGFILMVPAYSLDRSIARLSAEAGTNQFFILPQEAQVRLFPALPRASVTGVCAFDVSGSDVALTAAMPDGFWTLTIYSNRGDAIYSVNNVQSGTGTFTVGLSLAPDLVEMLQQATGKETLAEDTGWTVKSPEPRGLAVLSYPLSDGAQRETVLQRLRASRCQTIG